MISAYPGSKLEESVTAVLAMGRYNSKRGIPREGACLIYNCKARLLHLVQ
jgi:hypothetical protein